jgi:hypothetical protein
MDDELKEVAVNTLKLRFGLVIACYARTRFIGLCGML